MNRTEAVITQKTDTEARRLWIHWIGNRLHAEVAIFVDQGLTTVQGREVAADKRSSFIS